MTAVSHAQGADMSVLCRWCLTLLVATLLLPGCGGDADQNWRGSRDPHGYGGLQHFVPADPDSPYADTLKDCAHLFIRDSSLNSRYQFCPLSKLPFLGQESEQPTREQILQRTLVSHPWMATRFEQLLDEMPDDTLLLMRSITAVVIGADIRPAYYWSATGAIYLDPAALWLTASERSTISRDPDYRSDFGRDLTFNSRWRYVKGNDYAWPSYSLHDHSVASRPLEHIVQPMARLLFHELAHAADFIPMSLIHQLDMHDTPASATSKFANQRVSVQMTNSYPLQSDMLFGLAEVMFGGKSASTAQKNLSAEEVGLAFAEDYANDDYAYYSIYEDLAMLVEEVMMLYHFSTSREVGYTDAPQREQVYCEDLIVRWGVRHRVGDPRLRPRLQLGLQLLLDTQDVDHYLASLPPTQHLNIGVDWCTNLSQFGATKSDRAQARKSGLTPVSRSLDQHQPSAHHLPGVH